MSQQPAPADSQRNSKRQKRIRLTLRPGVVAGWLLGILLFVAFPVYTLYRHRDRPHQSAAATQPSPAPKALAALQVWGPHKRWAEWERKDAISFAFDHLDTQINLFMAGASAIVVAIAKIIVDSFWGSSDKNRPLTRREVVAAALVCGSCGWSIFFGMQAKSFFPRLADLKSISIYADMGVFAGHQILWFFLALAVLVIVLLVKAWKAAPKKTGSA